MSLLRDIRKELETSDCDITNVLRKCKILATRLGSEEFTFWVEWELNGYPVSQPTPEYRRLDARCYASFFNVVWRVERQPVLPGLIPEEARSRHVEFRNGIAKAKTFIASGARIDRPDIARWLQGKMYTGMDCYAAWLDISGSEFEQLLSAIKNRILDFTLKVEAENPQAGEAQPDSQAVPVKNLQPLVTNAFYGPVGNVAQNSGHFSQSASMGIQPQDLTRLVTDLTAHLNELNLDARQKQKAEAQLAALRAELGEPDPAIVRQAGRTLRNITEGAIGSLLAAAVQQPGVWHWIQQTLASF